MKEKIKNMLDITFWKFVLVGIVNTLVGTGGNVCCLQSFASELLGIFCIELCGGKYCELFPE